MNISYYADEIFEMNEANNVRAFLKGISFESTYENLL